ncbi:MAG: DUF2284 domain-containing protein [Myxococcota bacterium]|nr:DUF2284 domain-containing protein [Myxococcota bacterium]
MIDDNIQANLRKIFDDHHLGVYRFMSTDSIVFGQWVRMKCIYGCPSYGKCVVCPPNTPPVSECRTFVTEYDTAVLFHFSRALTDPEERHEWTRGINKALITVERAVFLAGHYKAFVLFVDPCNACKECAVDPAACNHPLRSRPSPEGLGIDVFATVREAGLPIEVLDDYQAVMNRYAILLVQ